MKTSRSPRRTFCTGRTRALLRGSTCRFGSPSSIFIYATLNSSCLEHCDVIILTCHAKPNCVSRAVKQLRMSADSAKEKALVDYRKKLLEHKEVSMEIFQYC
jgi:hypothetical protein